MKPDDFEIKLFDCNCMVGKRADRREGEPWSLEQLLDDMKYYRISEALVSHALSRDYEPAMGNLELVKVLKGSKHLFPVWCILPPASGEISASDAFVDNMLTNNIKAAISYPRLHNYSLASWSVGKLLSALEFHRIPLLLPFQQFDWNEIYAICHEYPALPVVTIGINYRQLRYLLALWEICGNLYVDLSWFSVADLFPFLKKRGYLEKLLFGTNYPAYTPSAAVSMITYANANTAEKNLVGSGNLKSIIGNIRRG